MKEKILELDDFKIEYLKRTKKYKSMKKKKYTTMIITDTLTQSFIDHPEYVKNIIIEYLYRTNVLNLRDFENIENIYLKNGENLGGFTIDYNILKKHNKNRTIDITLPDKNKINEKLNFVYSNVITPIKIDEIIKSISIKSDSNGNYNISFKTDTKNYNYYVDIDNKLKEHNIEEIEEKNEEVLDLKDIINSKLNLKSLNKKFDKIIIDPSIINTSDIDLSNIKFNSKKIIIRDNDMKLIPKDKIIEPHDKFSILNLKDKISIIVDKNLNKIINVISIDQDSNITLIDDNYIKNNYKNIDNTFVSYSKAGYLIVIQHKNKQYTIITDDNKIYKTNKLFDQIYKENRWKYFRIYIGLNDGINFAEQIINDPIIARKEIDNIFNDYYEYLNYLKELHNKGLSNRTLYSLVFDGFDSDEFLKKENIEELTSEEIKGIDKFVKILTKKNK